MLIGRKIVWWQFFVQLDCLLLWAHICTCKPSAICQPLLCLLQAPRWIHGLIQVPWEWRIPSSWRLPFAQHPGSKSQVLPLPLNAAFRSERFLIILMLSLGFLLLPLHNRGDCLWRMLLCAQLQQRLWKGSSGEALGGQGLSGLPWWEQHSAPAGVSGDNPGDTRSKILSCLKFC